MIDAETMTIAYGLHPSPFGRCLLALANGDVCRLAFMDKKDVRVAVATIRETWPEARISRDDARVAPYVKKIFGPSRRKESITLVAKGTDFQMNVWKALQAIPEGKTASYADVARTIGSPNAARAVGTACGKNPIGFLIPCHRVLSSGGGLGGYRWGIERKEAMLAWEAARA